MKPVLERIWQRRVVQWAVAYLAGAFVVLQLFDAIETPLGLSPAIGRGILVLLAAGLFATLILAWYHGEQGRQSVATVEVLILVAILLTTGAVLGMLGGEPPVPGPVSSSNASSPVEPDGIAVLRFDNLSDSSNDRLTDAIHDEILTHLSRVPGLNPISRTSVLALSGLNLTIPRIADTLGAQYVVEGSLQYLEDRVKVTAQLIDPVRDQHIWADDHEFRKLDLFGLQEEVAGWVVNGLLMTLQGVAAVGNHPGASVEEAYEEYLSGKHIANSRTREDLARAIGHFERAIQLDPEYAPAYAALALAYGLWGTYGYDGPYSTYQSYGYALAMADRAAELDPTLGDAHVVRAYLMSKTFGPADTVGAAFDRALQELPASADVRVLYAHFLAREGRFDESLAEAERATRLDPLAPGRDSGLGWDALGARRPDIALVAVERALTLEPALMTPRVIKGLALVLLDRSDECLDLDLGVYAVVRAICLHAAGRVTEAAAVADSVRAASPSAGPATVHLATYYAFTGNAEAALESIRRTFENAPSGLDFRVMESGVFDPVRADPAFDRGLERIRRDVWQRVLRERAAARQRF